MSVEKFMSTTGQFIPVRYTSTSTQPRAEFKGTVLTKRVRMTARAGINFANMQAVKDGIEAGTRGAVAGLQAGRFWVCFPYVIGNAEGGRYYRLTPVSVQSVVYMVNGEEVTREAWLGYLTPSARAKAESGERPLCIDVKAENCEFPDATDADNADAGEYPIAV